MAYLRFLVYAAYVVAFVMSADAIFAQRPEGTLEQREVELPQLRPGEACPISLGTRDTVPLQRHIFGAGGAWFGSGPVYLGLVWKDSADNDARFALERIPFDRAAYRAKTPWVSDPSYSGPILIRGRNLDASKRALQFDATGSGPREWLQLQAPRAPAALLWSFWPSAMWVPGPGCYGVQIDTLSGTDVVVFEAT